MNCFKYLFLLSTALGLPTLSGHQFHHPEPSEIFMAAIQIGDQAPDFTRTAQDGQQISLSQFRDGQAVVLFFYPRDNSLICTQQACSFRDAYEDFVKAGAVVIGVSGDSEQSHQEFGATQRLPFVLISDEDGSLRKAYGVPKTLGLLPGRVTYIIDRDGRVRHIFNSQLQANKHVTEALRVVRDIAGGKPSL